ncbi:MAG: homoserine dehydrogenase [Candidatus Calescibacterium sp.]|nr:homoserine dehydrogenase [Candidatus Calescibacterium sp.]MCX7734290.1 homoserine dehydrogenase [bacterium]MDW8087121.1 homoserine dehydrogenase [Candidatus Calescibacterium sp.]
MKKVKVAILGCGNVGKYVVKNLNQLSDYIKSKEGIELEITKILVKDKTKPRQANGFKIPKELLTTSFSDIIKTKPDIVVELIGDYENSRTFIKSCISDGIKVVTANKFLLSMDDDIIQSPLVFFDAAVGGGIPIIRTLQNAVFDEVYEITGILNGTTNFILTKLEEGMNFQEALELAQKLGYAEPDPSYDINGIDALQKICILSTVYFGIRPDTKKAVREGISGIDKIDIEFAKDFGYTIKPIATAKIESEQTINISVFPMLVPMSSSLAAVKGNLNAVLIRGKRIGELFIKGQGAGGEPTSISVISDIIEAARTSEPKQRVFITNKFKIAVQDEITSKFYVRIEVIDKPGVLAKIADSFGRNNVSIESVLQKHRAYNRGVPIFITTHECKEKNMRSALEECSKLDVVLETPFFLRVYSETKS